MRGETKVSIPTGSDKALGKLPRWFREFDRVLQQLTMGKGVLASAKISMLLGAWPVEGTSGHSLVVGKTLRTIQDTRQYLDLEHAGDHPSCFSMLQQKLYEFATPPAVARRNSEIAWTNVAWDPADNYPHHLHFHDIVAVDM